MTLNMKNEIDHGLELWQFLESEWERLGTRPTAWSRQANIPDATMLRWRDGVEPELRNLRRVANALNRPLVEILLAAKYVTPKEVNGQQIMERVYSVPEAIALDPALGPGDRDVLLRVYTALVAADGTTRRPGKKSTGRARS
jgi:predicted transcriptional regulator